jgi:hypothetical protein
MLLKRRRPVIENPGGERKAPMTDEDPYSGSSLLPMLVSGLVLIVLGMVAVVAFT